MSDYCKPEDAEMLVRHFTGDLRPEAGSRAASCSLSRWPTVAEIRSNYLTEGTGWTYAVVTGFRDYGPVVAKFYVSRGGRMDEGEEVWVDFPSGPEMTAVKKIAWDEGQRLRFLCVANAKDMERATDSATTKQP